LGRPQIQSGHYGEEKDLLPLSGIRVLFIGQSAHSLVTMMTDLAVYRELENGANLPSGQNVLITQNSGVVETRHKDVLTNHIT
jgi:hypothetical protein